MKIRMEVEQDKERIPYQEATVKMFEVLAASFGTGCYVITVAHDDDCPAVNGDTTCDCNYYLETVIEDSPRPRGHG